MLDTKKKLIQECEIRKRQEVASSIQKKKAVKYSKRKKDGKNKNRNPKGKKQKQEKKKKPFFCSKCKWNNTHTDENCWHLHPKKVPKKTKERVKKLTT